MAHALLHPYGSTLIPPLRVLHYSVGEPVQLDADIREAEPAGPELETFAPLKAEQLVRPEMPLEDDAKQV